MSHGLVGGNFNCSDFFSRWGAVVIMYQYNKTVGCLIYDLDNPDLYIYLSSNRYSLEPLS